MNGTGTQITVARKSGAAAALKRIIGLSKLAAYVGIPSATSQARSAQLLGMADNVKSKRKKARLQKAADADVTNAELLFIFSKGSPLREQPARPVLEPAVEADGNRQAIARELAGACKASIEGDHAKALKQTKRAALSAQNAARKWFTDPRNNWASLADSTKRGRVRRMSKAQLAAATDDEGGLKNSAFTPGVDTGAMRASIVGIVSEE